LEITAWLVADFEASIWPRLDNDFHMGWEIELFDGRFKDCGSFADFNQSIELSAKIPS
jgi:hypothetical protein